MLQIGGVALTGGLIPAVEERLVSLSSPICYPPTLTYMILANFIGS